MQLVRIYLIGVPLGLAALVALGLGGRNPFPSLARGVRAAWSSRGGRRVVALAGVAIVGITLESVLDPRVTGLLGYDLTRAVQAVEGELVARVQSTLPASAVDAASWVYMAGYVAALLAPLFVGFGAEDAGDERRAHATAVYALAFAANLALALPFYLFVPVQEVAWSGLSAARPLLEQTWPGVTADLRAGSALDNCFPSLHVSCTLTAALVARRSGPRALALSSALFALATAYAVMALGIHWALDVAAAAPFAWVCVRAGRALAPRVGYPPPPVETGSTA
jgi:membrane-associated phospholipid phosphatase